MSEALLFKDIDQPGLNTISVYEARGGYAQLRKAIAMTPAEVLAELEASGLRGRGGAGFQMGKKVSFLPQGAMDKYLVCNADESEPGTFKDRELMQKNPHMLIEGLIIASYAAGAERSFIYIRGEYAHPADILEAALAEAREAGYIGERILGSQHSLSLHVHRGAGAYICGEETGLLDSLEGKRGNPRLKPPFPANQGLYQGPTLINNVETLATVPSIIELGGTLRRARRADLDRHEAGQRLRARAAPGQLRGRTRHSVSRADLRPGRRPVAGTRDQVLVPRRLVLAGADAGGPRRPL